MINLFLLEQFKYFICLLIFILEKFIFKYHICKDIIQKILYVPKYDKIHSISILYLIFDIKIYTIQYLSNKIIKIYYNKEKISDIFISSEKNLTNTNKIVLSFLYLDQYHFINLLEIYNCGVIYHYTKLFTHVYNYLGNRRIEYNILPIVNLN